MLLLFFTGVNFPFNFFFSLFGIYLLESTYALQASLKHLIKLITSGFPFQMNDIGLHNRFKAR